MRRDAEAQKGQRDRARRALALAEQEAYFSAGEPRRAVFDGGGRNRPRTRGIQSIPARWRAPRAYRGGSSSGYGRAEEGLGAWGWGLVAGGLTCKLHRAARP